jgi:hypothetical protein
MDRATQLVSSNHQNIINRSLSKTTTSTYGFFASSHGPIASTC